MEKDKRGRGRRCCSLDIVSVVNLALQRAVVRFFDGHIGDFDLENAGKGGLKVQRKMVSYTL